MTDSRAAALDADRLPWLTAEPKPAVASGWSLLMSWGVALLLLVAGGAYWLGRTSNVESGPESIAQPPRATLTLPEPVIEPAPVPAAPKIEPAPPPPAAEVAPQRSVPAEPAAETRAPAKPAKTVRSDSGPAAKARKAATARKPTAAKPKARRSSVARMARARQPARAVRRPAWPSPPTALYLGRMIQLGTYSSRPRLERAWAYRVQRYPQLRGLPKVVVPYRDAYGSTRYRLQAMTVAPQQASWLCRKIRAEWKSCSVLRAKTANG